jgi:excisionase family DNA binding protein
MNKKEVSEPVGIFTRIAEKHSPADWLGEADGKLKDAPESPNAVLAVKSPDAHLFAASTVKAIKNSDEPRSASVRTSEKLLLNLNDCRLLTGLSDDFLRDAIKTGTLKAKIIGRGYKIKRQDLDGFVNNL